MLVTIQMRGRNTRGQHLFNLRAEFSLTVGHAHWPQENRPAQAFRCSSQELLSIYEAWDAGGRSTRFAFGKVPMDVNPQAGARRDNASADFKASPFANRFGLLISLRQCPSMTAWFTSAVGSKSSASTISQGIL